MRKKQKSWYIKKRLPPQQRFEASIFRSPDGCWYWTKGRTILGYGLFYTNGRCYQASRYSFELFKGPIPNGLWVLHKCDNPPCVNPEHLFLGTPKDNSDDMMSKGRHTAKVGIDHGGAKLTEEQVLQILHDSDTASKVASKHGITGATVFDIKSGRSWTHLTGKGNDQKIKHRRKTISH